MITGDRSVAAGKPCAFAETLRGLSQHCERIDVLCPRVDGSRIVRSCYGNVFLHPSRVGRWLAPLSILWRGHRLLREEHRYDVCTIHEYPPFLHGLGARLLLRSYGVPTVLEVHHIVGWPRAASLAEWIGRLMMRWVFPRHARRFRAVRVVNHEVRDRLIAWGVPHTQLQVVPSVYLDRALLLQARGVPRTVDLVTCGRLVPGKRVDRILRAVAQVPGVTLRIIGDGPERRSLERLASRLGVMDRVTFTGWLPSPLAVLREIASAKLFVLASASEGNPRVAVEALALGVPLLSTRVGIVPEILKDGVQGTFTDGSVRDIVLRATQLLGDPASLATMGDRSLEAVQSILREDGIGHYAQFLQSMMAH